MNISVYSENEVKIVQLPIPTEEDEKSYKYLLNVDDIIKKAFPNPFHIDKVFVVHNANKYKFPLSEEVIRENYGKDINRMECTLLKNWNLPDVAIYVTWFDF